MFSSGAFGGLHDKLLGALGDAVIPAREIDMNVVAELLQSPPDFWIVHAPTAARLGTAELDPNARDRWITRVFVPRAKRPRAVRASRFVREIEPQLRRFLVRRARLHPYYIDHAITLVKQRSRQLDLVLRTPRRDAKRPVVRLHERIVLDILYRNRENYAL